MPSLPSENMRYTRIAAYLLTVIAVIFYISTIRPGHDWGGDFALYIAHAKNIATGHPYADTGFVYNPHEPFLSPRSYPPVFPLILSPVYAAFGLDLHAMKVADILIFAVFLLVFFRYTERRLDHGMARVALLAMVAFSPWFWDVKDLILPDFAFLMFLFITLMYVDSRQGKGKFAGGVLPAAIITGVLVYLSYGTRSVGMFLVPAMVLHDLVRFRTLKKSTLLVAVLFAAFYLAQNAWLQTDASYLESIESVAEDELDEPVDGAGNKPAGQRESVLGCGKPCLIVEELATRVPGKIYYYSQVINSYWENGFSAGFGRGVFIVVGVFAVLGFISQISRRPSLGDYFVLTYVAVLLVVPFQQMRYMLPLVPFYLFYAVSGIDRLAIRLSAKGRPTIPVRGAAIAIFAFVLALSHIGKYSTFDSGEMERGVETATSQELFEYIRATPADSLFVFHKPRPLALFTGRRSVRYHWEPDVEKLWIYLSGIGATHIIKPKYASLSRHTQYFFAMIESYQGSLDTEFENKDYLVYRIAPE